MELRPPTLRDLGDYRRLFLDPQVSAWLRPEPLRPMGAGDALVLLERDIDHWRKLSWGPWAVVGDDGAFAGRAGLCRTEVEGAREVEIAWSIVPASWGRGFATTAAREAVSWAGTLGLSRVVALTLPSNVASRRVMEKAGLVFERDVIHAGLPHVLYSAAITAPCASSGTSPPS